MILLTGGLGYIGSHLAVELLNDNHSIVILDDLSRSKIETLDHIKTITHKHPIFYQGCISDTVMLTEIFETYPITAVVHLAGYKSVKESEKYPERYWDNNVNKSITFLDHIQKYPISTIIFSSSATVYAPSDLPLTETSPTNPQSTYGTTKLVIEQILEKIQIPHITVLRYFNPINEHPSGLLKDTGSDNLYPNIRKALDTNSTFHIYGSDYPTKDGTAIRDYISIQDLTKYHKFFLTNPILGYNIYNLGTGIGKSVLDIVSQFSTLIYTLNPKRPGDTPISVCDITKLKSIYKE